MKKIICLVLVALMAIVPLAGCGGSKNLKIGLGVYSYIDKVMDAEGDTEGVGQAVITAAAVLLDGNGKIVDCVIDSAQNAIGFTSDGKAVTAGEFKTKYELGDDYGMKAYGNAVKEWYAQVDALISVIKGKTVEDARKLVVDGKGNDEVINAGCTIEISDFIIAVERAVESAKESNATNKDSLKLGIVSSQSDAKDATEEANGSNGFEVSISAACVSKDAKVTAISSDVVGVKFAFDAKGALSTTKGEVKSKRQSGDNYGMKAYGNAEKEWYEQADAFDAQCTGKTSNEISAMVADNGYGTDGLISAGCTIIVSDMVKAAVKAAKVN